MTIILLYCIIAVKEILMTNDTEDLPLTLDQKLDMLMGAMLAQQKLLTQVLLGFDSTLSKVIEEVKKPKSIIQLQ